MVEEVKMDTLIVTFVVMAIALTGMSVGVIFSNKALKGSCGGLGAIMGDDCDICGKKDECEERMRTLAKLAES